MPGGIGTFEEFFEILTWAQLGFHEKPCAVLNIAGYYDGLLALCDTAVSEGFLRHAHRQLILEDSNPVFLLEKMKNEVQTLKDQLEEIQYDKESHIECARNCADFAVKYYELRDMIDKIKEILS